MERIKVRINRSHWTRGNDGLDSALLVDRGTSVDIGKPRRQSERKCCLGFVALACGIKPSDIRGKVNFSALAAEDLDKIPAALRPGKAVDQHIVGKEQCSLHDALVHVNDHPHQDLRSVNKIEDREAEIVRLLALGGVDAEFVG